LLVNSADADDNEEGDSRTYANTARNGVSIRRKRLFLGLSGAAIAIVGIVLLVVGLVFGLRIHKRNGNQEVPDYSKLPGPKPGLRNPSYLVRGRHGAVATESEICSKIGLDVLKEGGTATDAAISGALCGEL
jgi:gamma-glutamyltranspeptidase/glutathione hydrolase/leukotriene-C4 hydrolase